MFLLHSVGSSAFPVSLHVPALVPHGFSGLFLVFVFVCSSVLDPLQSEFVHCIKIFGGISALLIKLAF